ncbi:MAG: HDOD domain-containing protein [Gammaproteobacteria bacterium]
MRTQRHQEPGTGRAEARQAGAETDRFTPVLLDESDDGLPIIEIDPGAADRLGGLVDTLNEDLRCGKLEIPGFPDIAMRLNRALGDENAPVSEIVKLINSEPGLVSRLLKIANSPAFTKAGNNIADLQTAVNRLGFKFILSAANSYSLRQIERQEALKPIRPWLAEIWLSSNSVAAICFVVAKRIGLLANEAMVAGLLHQLGNLYLLVQAQNRGVNIQDDAHWDAFVRQWHPTIASEILTQWGLPAFITDAVETQDTLLQSEPCEMTPFATLLAAAKLYNSVRDQQTGKSAHKAAAALEPLELWGRSFLTIVAESSDEIESVRTAIS